MKKSRKTKLDRIFLLKATLLAAMIMPVLAFPVYAQQEVDPTWYDPWPAQTKVVVQPAKLRTPHREPAQSTNIVFHRSPAKRTRARLSAGQRQAVVAVGHSQGK